MRVNENELMAYRKHFDCTADAVSSKESKNHFGEKLHEMPGVLGQRPFMEMCSLFCFCVETSLLVFCSPALDEGVGNCRSESSFPAQRIIPVRSAKSPG